MLTWAKNSSKGHDDRINHFEEAKLCLLPNRHPQNTSSPYHHSSLMEHDSFLLCPNEQGQEGSPNWDPLKWCGTVWHSRRRFQLGNATFVQAIVPIALHYFVFRLRKWLHLRNQLPSYSTLRTFVFKCLDIPVENFASQLFCLLLNIFQSLQQPLAISSYTPALFNMRKRPLTRNPYRLIAQQRSRFNTNLPKLP